MLKKLIINELECLAIVIAIKAWAHKLDNTNLLLHCDNFSTVEIVNKGKSRHPFSQACLREIVWFTAQHNVWIKVVFVRGVSNRFTDLLSRWHLGPQYKNTFLSKTEGKQKKGS